METNNQIEFKDIPIGAEYCIPTCQKVRMVKISEDKYVLSGQRRVWNWREPCWMVRRYILINTDFIETRINELKDLAEKI